MVHMQLKVSALILLLVSTAPTTGFAVSPNPDRAADLRKQAEAVGKDAEGFAAQAAKAPGELAESAVHAATVCREVAGVLEALATAVGIGVNQEEAIETANASLTECRKRQTAAVERLTIRQAIAALQPGDATIESLIKTTPESLKPLLDALLSAKKRARAAGSMVHDSIAPEANLSVVEALRDAWIRAQNDLTLASRAVNDASERARLSTRPGADRPVAVAKLAEIAARDEELLNAHAAVLSATLEARLVERKRAYAADAYAGTTWATLTSLTLEQAQAWAALERAPVETTHHGDWSVFHALTTVSPEVAEVLAQPEGRLSFKDLSELSPADWGLLQKTKRLSLNGLTDLSTAVAAALAKHPPIPRFGQADLQLNGLRKLSPQAAEALSRHEGMIQLYGLDVLDSVPLAGKLARQWGELRLEIKQLTPEIASELAKHRGYEKTFPRMNYHGRTDGAISVLRLDNIESLTAETAEALSAHEGVLVLNGLASLEPEVAVALAKRTGNRKSNRPGTLVLNGLKTLSAESATALAAFTGELVLKAIRELSPAAAAALAKHPGRLHLTGLTRLSPECLATLQTHKNLLLPSPLPLTAANQTPKFQE